MLPLAATIKSKKHANPAFSPGEFGVTCAKRVVSINSHRKDALKTNLEQIGSRKGRTWRTW